MTWIDIIKLIISFCTSILLIYIGYLINKKIKINHLKKYLGSRLIIGLDNFPEVATILKEMRSSNNGINQYCNLLIINKLPKEFAVRLIDLDLSGIEYYGNYIDLFDKFSRRVDEIESILSTIKIDYKKSIQLNQILDYHIDTAINDLILFGYGAFDLLKYLNKNKKLISKEKYFDIKEKLDGIEKSTLSNIRYN